MFKEIYRFELALGFKKASTYIYFSVLFVLALLMGMLVSGVFNLPKTDTITLFNSSFYVSSFLVGTTSSILGLLTNIFLISILSPVIQRDFEYNVHSMFFTKPVSKAGYFFGRFAGGFTLALFVFSGLVLGYMCGTLFGLGKYMMGPFEIGNFLWPFIKFTVPNLFILGIVFFSVATYTRSLMPAYIAAIFILVLQIIAAQVVSNIDYKNFAAMLEPTGARAFSLLTQYWTPDQRNNSTVNFEGVLLNNRLLWLGIALLISYVSYHFFSFSQDLSPLRLFGKRKKEAEAGHSQIHSLADLPVVSQDFGFGNWVKQILFMAGTEFRRIIISPFFIIIVCLAVVIMLVSMMFVNRMYNVNVYPVTYQIIEAAGVLPGMLVLFILFYTGTSIWRDQETKMDELIGTTPISNLQIMLAKLGGFVATLLLVSILACFIGIGFQMYNGFYDIDVSQYIVFIFQTVLWSTLFSGACLAIQAFSPNKLLGFVFVLFLLMILPAIFDYLDWNSTFISLGSDGNNFPYSDMNGYANNFLVQPFYNAYWLAILGLLLLLGSILYQRGQEKGYKPRWDLGSADFNSKRAITGAALGVVALAAAAFISYQIFYLRDTTKAKVFEKETAEMEKKYKRYQKTPQPRITESKIAIDLFPSKNTAKFAGAYVLKNIGDQMIDTLFISYPGGRKSSFTVNKLEPSIPYTQVENNTVFGFKIVKLTRPMQPGDSIHFSFDIDLMPRGLFDRNQTSVVGNGSFLNNFYLPTIGYNENVELSQAEARKEYGLPPKERKPDINDTIALKKNYISQDGDWINFEATLSTDEGQTAIAPGYLQKQWNEKGRSYFHYKMDSPMLNFYSILSAKYEVKRDKWKDINIEVFYHKGHEYNIDRMINSIKRSLDYYTANFGPYQHRQVRILEFPRYAAFAQSFPNTIPYSEGLGFITKVTDAPGEIDLPFYITAHEMAHQWWGHQVVGGNVQGAELMSESLCQYSALMVMEKMYGKESMKKFLKYELNGYLRSRPYESRGEMPLMLVENQQYIHYNKGSLAMYALKEYLGEENLNKALRSFLGKYKFQGPPYPNAFDFVQEVKAVTPDSLQYFVSDIFEKIVIYENYTRTFTVTPLAGNQWKVNLTVGMNKYGNTGITEFKVDSLHDYVDIGIFAPNNSKDSLKLDPIVVKRVKMTKPVQSFEFTVDRKPGSAGIDPYLLLIDRSPDNNMLNEGQKPGKVDTSLNNSGRKGFEITVNTSGEN